ncbi:hypothetical protein NQ317_007850 [Molorchus minor]|uniref:THAP-type domain-containing protein n=1 Tax=Molorchus minor TaxID=1323400 RepID=A0ABQ9JSP8_9CUCU|nr:hypothetical protein NQ317_007850 [Molorchus minor]
MNFKYYKYCLVPQCKSTTIKTPNKLIIYVPNNEQIRKKWLKLARRDDVHSLSTNLSMQIILITYNFWTKAYSRAMCLLNHFEGFTCLKVQNGIDYIMRSIE